MTEPTSPKPTPPKPRPVPAPSLAAPAAPVARDRSAELAAAREFGRVDENNTVFVKTADGEREVGQYPDADQLGALDYFAKKYLDLVDAAAILEERLAAGANADSIKASASTQRESLVGALAVGDLAALDERLAGVENAADAARAQQQAAHEEARQAGLQARTKVVEEAEAIAAADPARVQWKQSGARMNELFNQWKQVQANSPRLPRSQDQELWGRFSKARNTFDKHRREFFSDLDKRNAEGKRIKEKLVAEAQALSNSTEWRETAAKYRDLMDRWKAAPRAGRKDDDSLWAKFRAAQDVFFNARAAENKALDAQYGENLKVKEELLAQAQALLPVEDIEATKRQLRQIQDKWEDAGRVPRADVSRMEGGLRAVERALAEAEEAEWRRTNPETRARTSGLLAQLEDSVAELEADLAKAQETGNEKKIKAATEALETKREWLAQMRATASDLVD